MANWSDNPLAAVAKSIGVGALDLALPPRCLACRQAVPELGRLCARCWAKAEFIAAPHCAVCGLPFPFDPGPGSICGTCLAQSPSFAKARAVMRYGPVAAALAIALKHRDQTYLAPALASWLARAGAELLGEADLLVPVPLHWTRLIRRRYNQSALLAMVLARWSGVAYRADVLRRVRLTPSQAGMSRAQRADNVAGAFAVPARWRPALAGKRVLLIDDVMTTGATAEACARTLLAAGAGQVDLLTLARVVASD